MIIAGRIYKKLEGFLKSWNAPHRELKHNAEGHLQIQDSGTFVAAKENVFDVILLWWKDSYHT